MPTDGTPNPAGEGRKPLNLRGLLPPQPMLRILAALATLPAGDALEVILDRRPVHLYPRLEGAGFTHETREEADGVHVVIRRARKET